MVNYIKLLLQKSVYSIREECSVVSTNNKQFCSVRLVSEVSNIFHEEPMNPTNQAVCELIIFMHRAQLP